MNRPFPGVFDTLMSGGGGGGGAPAPGGGAPAPGGGGAPNPDPGTAVPYFRGLFDDTGKLNHANFDRLPEHLKPAAASLKNLPSVDALLGAYWNATQLVGKKGLMPLPDGADEAAQKEFNTRLREILKVPAKPEEYGVKKPDGLPDSLWDQQYVDAIVQTLHKHNAPPGLVQDLLKVDGEFARNKSSRIETEQMQQHQQAVTKLREEYGPEFERNVALSKQIAINAGLDPNNPAIGDNPDLIRAFVRIGKLLGEDKIAGGPGGGGGPDKGKTYGEQANAIVFDKQHPDHAAYHSASHPQHKAVTEKVSEFFRMDAEQKRRQQAGAR